MYTKSTCLSADVTAAYDPTYASAYEAGNSCYLNRGVGVAKYTGSRGKGGSNDANAEFVAQVRKIFDDNNVLFGRSASWAKEWGGGGTVALDISRMTPMSSTWVCRCCPCTPPLKLCPSWTSIWLIKPLKPTSRQSETHFVKSDGGAALGQCRGLFFGSPFLFGGTCV